MKPLNLTRHIGVMVDADTSTQIERQARRHMQSASSWVRALVLDKLAAERDRARPQREQRAEA